MAPEPSARERAWADFDALIGGASADSPWVTDGTSHRFEPLYPLLERLLEVPLRHGCTTQSGLPAKAVDVWVASELRRAGFEADEAARLPACISSNAARTSARMTSFRQFDSTLHSVKECSQTAAN